MCECGCISGDRAYKLKAPNGWYVIEMLSGCEGCCHGPGISIQHPEAAAFMGDADELPELPVIGTGEHAVTMIACGMTKDEAEEAVKSCMVGAETDDNKIDAALAEVLGEELWCRSMTAAPRVIYPNPAPAD